MLSMLTAWYLQSLADSSFDRLTGASAGDGGGWLLLKLRLRSGSSSASPCDTVCPFAGVLRGDGDVLEVELRGVSGRLDVNVLRRCTGRGVLKTSASGGGMNVSEECLLVNVLACEVTAGERYSSSFK